MTWYQKFFSTILLILVCCQSPAQDHNFDRLSLEDGLSQSTVIDLVQDKKGFLWIGTMDGLNCFDGYGFKVFKNEPFDSTSLSVNFISTLMVDADGGLWVGTRGGGLHYYLSGKEEFIRCKLETNNTSSISNNFISYIHQTAKGDIWVGTANGLNKVKLNKKDQDVQITFERFLHNPERIRGESQSEHYIRALHSDKQNRLWVGTAVNLLRFDKELHADTVPTISFNFDPEDKNSLSGKSVTCIEEDGQGNLWIGTYSGLNLFLGDEKGFQRFYGEKVSGQLPSSEIFDMAKQADGTLVITTFEGISQLSINENKPQEPFYTFSDISIPGYNMSISRLTMQDRLNENILWIGTAEAGLLKVNRKPKQFYSNDLAGANPVGLKTPSIFGICKDDDGRIWMSSQNGLLEFERATNQFVLHDYNREKENELAGKYVSSMMVDSKGNLWAGTYYGLFRLDEYKKERPKFKSYIDQFHGKDRGVLCLYEDKNDNIYFGSFTGINYYDPVGDSVLNYPVILDTISAAKSDYSVRGFLSDRNDNLWVATSIGLILLENIKDPVTDIPNAITQVFFHDESDKTSLRSDYITSLMEDNKGRIWAGTYNGLIEVKKSETDISFKSYTEQDGLSNNLVYGILKDEATGYLWLSTNMGLSRFDPDTKQFDRYLAEDGLQSSEFNSAAFSKANDGEMLFGGVNGFTSFFPSNITSESSLPPVWLRSLTTLDGTHFNLLEDNQHIQLPYRQNSFAVDFVGLNYAYPDRVQYAYSIDNQDDTWISIGNARRVDFTRLAPGRYTLKVKASNHDGLWNESFAASNIEIKGPFWKTGWFFGLIIMGFGLMAFYLHRVRWQWKMKKIAEIDRFRKITSQDFHDELGSKLTIISLFSEITRDKLNGDASIVGPYLDKVIDTSNSLYHSMKDLIWALNPEQDTVRDLAIQIKDFGDDLFDKTEVDFRTEGLNQGFLSKELPMEYKRHILLVFKEAMNNVLKHSECKTVCLRLYNGNNSIKFELEDDGKGFNSTIENSGDGLNNMASRAERISAVLKVDSAKGKGTSITLECPLLN